MHENAAHPYIGDKESPQKNEAVYFEQRIDSILDSLQSQGLDTRQWNDEYLDVPDEVEALKNFYNRLKQFLELREDALLAFDFSKELSETEKDRLKQFDRDVRAAFRNPDAFLGNGATAEVYSMPNNTAICVKFIINQERYNENNHLRKEFHFLSNVFEHTKGKKITTPYPFFLRIHANEGHSYGMEKIQGASLSQILEQPEKYAELLRVAAQMDRKQVQADLLDFIESMHEARVVHGDLYQRNIMFDKDGGLCVIDFGKAHQIEFPGQKEEDRNLDKYTAQQSLRDFFNKVDLLTNISK